MQGNRRRDTQPEMRLRRALFAIGLRFRVDFPIRPGAGRPVRPDIAFTRLRVAVFVDGCFWHLCPEHSVIPRSNRSYWEPKLARNAERDRQVDERLVAAGWQVVRVWEHEGTDEAAERIRAVLQDADSASTTSQVL